MGKLIEFKTDKLPDVLLIGKEIRYSMEALMNGDNRLAGTEFSF